MNCPVTDCVCATRRNPAALPSSAHRPRVLSARDRAYRSALGVTSGPLPRVAGTIAHGGTAAARRSAARNSHRRSAPPRGARV